MSDVQRALGRIEAKLDDVREDVRDSRKRMDSHAARLGGLETSRSKFMGMVAAVGFAFSFMAHYLRSKLIG